MKKIYLIIDNESFFADHLQFDPLNKYIVVDFFKKHNIDINILSLSKLSYRLDIENSIIFTVSSQKPYQKSFIEDLYEFLELNNNILIPSINVIKSHDNKGYQEFYKKFIELNSLKSLYINKDTVNYAQVKEIGYPIVLKKPSGSGSRGVQLIQCESKLKKEVNKIQKSFNIRYLIYLKEKLKNIFLKKNNIEKIEYFKDYNNYILQEFVPNLKFDYKILIFFDKFYILKRNIKDGDFRASGSGDFEFVKIEDSLLEYAEMIFKKFNEPFMSFDICFDGDKYYLIEYQGIHFGQYTQIYAKGFYQKRNNRWSFIEKKVSLEEDIAYSLFYYLKNKSLIKETSKSGEYI